jgi:hypothetical protein
MKLHPTALFRLTVLGPLASRDKFEYGEPTQIIRELAQQNIQYPSFKACSY